MKKKDLKTEYAISDEEQQSDMTSSHSDLMGGLSIFIIHRGLNICPLKQTLFRPVVEELITEYRPIWVILYRMCDCVYVMLLFVLFMRAFGAEENTTLCEMLGSPDFPLLSKEGDITIGGAFSIHSQISKPPLSFIDTPDRLKCTRYCLFSPVLFVDF